jgi:hypothetical protein
MNTITLILQKDDRIAKQTYPLERVQRLTPDEQAKGFTAIFHQLESMLASGASSAPPEKPSTSSAPPSAPATTTGPSATPEPKRSDRGVGTRFQKGSFGKPAAAAGSGTAGASAAGTAG